MVTTRKIEIDVPKADIDISDLELPQVGHLRNNKTVQQYQHLLKDIKGLLEADKVDAVLHLIKVFEKES